MPPPALGFSFDKPKEFVIVSSEIEHSVSAHINHDAGVAQLVEHNLAKVGVAGSSPVTRLSQLWFPALSHQVWNTDCVGGIAKW